MKPASLPSRAVSRLTDVVLACALAALAYHAAARVARMPASLPSRAVSRLTDVVLACALAALAYHAAARVARMVGY
ncbi:hypothetical protein JYU34_009873 [Plutella xylostella]|uniref:Uncharacterized protein n=1 Tax=Plutella xylostella TaxID=51655 RepID=A0ABQ7QLH9_PLUXY|nr:hypothetical protein JYU34_009873 [Plutella xylostella]